MTADSLAGSSAQANVQRIQDRLWLDIDGSYNADKPWYPDTIDEIAAILAECGLRSEQKVMP